MDENSPPHLPARASAAKQGKPLREWGFWTLSFLPWVAVLIRFWVSTVPEFGFFPLPMALLGAFLVLSVSVPAISTRYPVLTQPCLFLQTALIAVLIQSAPLQDYYAMLFLSLGPIATRYLRPGRALIWLAAFCVVVSAALILAFGPARGVTYFPIYVVGILILGFYGRASRRAKEAREESERLLDQLRDAATQTVFSITLTAQAARMACKKDPSRLPELLDKIQESGADALAEMRGLVSELRPRRVAEDGLVPTLRQHFALRERREQLRVIFSIEGEERGGVEGFGLASMRERVESRGGTFQVFSRPGAGTEITVGMLPDIQIVGEAASGREATRRLHADCPGAKVIVLTSFAEEDKIFAAIRAGAMGYLQKDMKPADLAETIRAVARGESRLAPDITRKVMSGIAEGEPGQKLLESLTEREAEVLGCLACGLPNREIAGEQFIAEKTVKTHISNILSKLGLADRTQAAV